MGGEEKKGKNGSFFFQAEDGMRGSPVAGVQTCARPISLSLRFQVVRREFQKCSKQTEVSFSLIFGFVSQVRRQKSEGTKVTEKKIQVGLREVQPFTFESFDKVPHEEWNAEAEADRKSAV